MKRILPLLGIPLFLLLLTPPVSAADLRPFERTGRVGRGAPPVDASAPAPRLTANPVVVVDDDFPLVGTVTVGANNYTMGTDAFTSVQAAIDAVDPGGTVLVLPGAYSETAAGRMLFDASGPYTFGLFVGDARAGITIQGVDAGGAPITSAGAAQATINTNATNDFGPSGFFIEGDDVTLAGVKVGTNSAGQNKTLEVIGDNFTLTDCNVIDVYGSLYFNDWRYDTMLDVSHIQSYHVTDCIFGQGVSLDLASGAGFSGPASGRVISGNAFQNGVGDYWPMISFNGADTGVPWFVYSVGGAVITGNTFANADPAGQDIRARGTYDNSQFDWAGFWNLNTFDRAVTVGPAPPGSLRAYSYVSGPYTFNNVRRIGAALQPALDVAAANDIVLAAAGTYPLVATLTAGVPGVTLQGAGVGNSVIQGGSSLGNLLQVTGAGTTLRDFTIQKTNTANQDMIWINAPNVTVRNNEIFGPDPGSPWSVNGIVSRAMIVSGGANGLSIHDNLIHHLRQPCYITGGNGTIANNVVYGTRGWVLEGGFITFTGNSWSTGGNQGADIALLSGVNPLDYPDLLALSNANNDAFISAQFVGGANGRAIGYVDDGGVPDGFGMSTNPYPTVTGGVGGTLPGGTVSVAAGSYTEQVVVTGKNLTIQGAGRALTTIVSPVSLPQFFTTPGNNNYPVVLARNAGDVRVQDLTIDGAGRGVGNYRFQGVAWFNAGGKLLNCDVTRIRETPFNGNQHGVAVYGYSDTGGPYALEVGGCNLTDFQKNGTVFASAALTVNMHDCVVTGQGQTALNAQNGLQVSGGAAASVTNCAVSGIYYTGPGVTATGQLFYGAGAVSVSGGSVIGCQAGTYFIDCAGSMTGTSTSTPLGGGIGTWGIAFYNSSLTAAPGGHEVTDAAAPARPEAQPMDVGEAPAGQAPGTGVQSTLNVTLTGGCLTGPGTGGSEGIEVYSEGGGMNVTATGMEISDWGWGIWVGGPGGASMDANHNRITDNTIGYEGQLTATHLAERNWWGDPGGPGVGGANPVVGAGVDYAPWLISGTDANPGCGFSAGGDNAITPLPPVNCLSITNTCLTVPVTITRTDSSPMRGYSVQLALSPELDLCSGTGSITQGGYLPGTTSFQVVSLGGGVYTVDCAILGASPCATAPTGTLFSVAVKRTVSSGTGTVTVTPIKARDCVNAPIPVSAGAPAAVTIDAVVPATVTGLVAVQDKSGNGGSGRTAINLSFTPSGNPSETTEIYRAPWGGYPEYDDAGFAAPPATPSYPPGGVWTLAGTQAAHLGAFVDAPPTRDFWYYVAFTRDACGNVSAVSNKTGGTLDYHLGDTHDGFTNCAGNNLVNLGDVSFLGAHYGVAVPYNAPFNCLDVGPTTDYSVDKRPTTDNMIDFEDLIMFAINYGQVSKPTGPVEVDAAAANELSLQVPALPARGELFEVALALDGAGDIQGLSIDLAYNPLVVQPDAVTGGELLTRQGQGSTVLSARPGNVDVALLGVAQGLAGQGELARVAFRVVGDGDAGLGVRQVRARDGLNRPVTIGQRNEPIGPVHPPVVNYLGANYPNPFMQSTVIPFGVKEAGRARLSVFDVQGRLVRGLLDGEAPAGERVLTWDGRDDGGAPVASGLYLVRLEVGGQVLTRSLKLVK